MHNAYYKKIRHPLTICYSDAWKFNLATSLHRPKLISISVFFIKLIYIFMFMPVFSSQS